MPDLTPYPDQGPKKSLLFVTQLVYILHGLSIVIGLMTGATIISAFLFGWPSIAAVILNYIMAPDARGTFLQSHFSWQIRTFWYGMVWTILVAIVGIVLRSLYLAGRLCDSWNLGGLPHYHRLASTAPIPSDFLRVIRSADSFLDRD